MRADNFPYVEGQPAEIYFDGKWHRGKIIAGYRFRDGIVTIQTEDGQKIGCGESRKNGKQKAFEAVPETQNQRLFKSQYVNNSIHVYYTILAATSQTF